MQTRPLGTTGRVVSRIGLGLAAAGRPGYLDVGHGTDLGEDRSQATMRARAHELLDTALGGDITHIDTARSYGLAEDFLADWAADRALGSDQLTISTKWGYRYTAGWAVDVDRHEVKDHSVAHLDAQWAESLALLGDRATILQIHSATTDSGVLADRAVLDRLATIRESGMLIGVTASGPDQRDTVRRAMDVAYDGAFLFATVQATWNVLEPSVGDALAEAHEEGIGVIVKESMANGRLGPRGQDHVRAPRWDRYDELVQEHETTHDAVAIAAALARPFADVVLSGATTADQLTANLTADGLVLDDRALGLLDRLAEPADEYWAYRARLPWT